MSQLNPEDLVPMKKLPLDPEFSGLFTKGQWEWVTRHRHQNGLNSAIVAIGPRRLLVSKAKLREWLDSRVEGQATDATSTETTAAAAS